MRPLEPGAPAPEIPGVQFDDVPVALLFYKVTCPTCQLVAPVAERLAGASTGRLMGVAQDPPDRVDAFAREYRITFPSVSDAEPYDTSNAYGIRVVPTLFVIGKNAVAEAVESWDREGWNRVGAYFGSATGSPSEPLSAEGDGLPPFRPG